MAAGSAGVGGTNSASVTVPINTTSVDCRPRHSPGAETEQAQAFASTGNAAIKNMMIEKRQNFTQVSYNFSELHETRDRIFFQKSLRPFRYLRHVC